MKRMDERLLLGKGCMIGAASSVPAKKSPANYEAIESNREAILSKVRASQDFRENISNYLQELHHLSPLDALSQLSAFLYRFRVALPVGFPAAIQDDYAFGLLFNHPEELETLQSIENQLMRLAEKLEIFRVQKANDKSRQVVQQAKQYIATHYADPNLSTDSIAEALVLSAGYLRKLFRASEGVGISESIMNTRLDAARDLLLTTSLTAATICEKIGIYNTTYFSTVFKRRFGTTPILYRQSIVAVQKRMEEDTRD